MTAAFIGNCTYQVCGFTPWSVVGRGDLDDISSDNVEIHDTPQDFDHLACGPTTRLRGSRSYQNRAY